MDKQSLPTFKLIGRPRQLPTHGVKSKNYYQLYRLPPSTKVLSAPCCDDFKQSQSMAASYVVAHIEKRLAKDAKPNYAELTLAQHIDNYKEALEADDNSRKYVRQTITRIRAVCNGCGWRMIDDMDGLRAKAFVKKLTCGDMTKGYYLSSLKSFTKSLAENGRKRPVALFESLEEGRQAEANADSTCIDRSRDSLVDSDGRKEREGRAAARRPDAGDALQAGGIHRIPGARTVQPDAAEFHTRWR